MRLPVDTPRFIPITPGAPESEPHKPGMGAVSAAAASGQQPSWLHLARLHAGTYAGLAALLLLTAASEHWDPFHRALYVGHTSDLETWKYSYPFKANTVPAWAVPW